MNTQLLDENFAQPDLSQLDNATIVKINDAKIQMQEDLDHVKAGRVVLFVLAGLILFSLAANFFTGAYEFVDWRLAAIESVIMIAIYVVLGILVPRNPLTCLAAGAAVYAAITLIYGYILPETLTSGLFIKIAVIYAFFRGINGAMSLRKTSQRLRGFGVPEQDIQTAIRKMTPLKRTPRASEVSR